jgi:hypothetical protein
VRATHEDYIQPEKIKWRLQENADNIQLLTKKYILKNILAKFAIKMLAVLFYSYSKQ